jgi:hypothetical protein
MQITVAIKNVYGNELIYPAYKPGENEAAELFLALTGKKTFSRSDIKLIKSLGYDVAVAPQEL